MYGTFHRAGEGAASATLFTMAWTECKEQSRTMRPREPAAAVQAYRARGEAVSREKAMALLLCGAGRLQGAGSTHAHPISSCSAPSAEAKRPD